MRVSASEKLRNLYRQGGIKTVAAYRAVGAAKNEERLLDYIDRVKYNTADSHMEDEVIADTASHAAAYFKKNDLPLPPPKEFTHFVAALHAVRLGFDRGVVRSMGQDYLLESASAAIYLNEGHIAPLGMRSDHRNSVIEIPDEKTAPGALKQSAHANPGTAADARQQAVIDGQRYSRHTENVGSARPEEDFRNSVGMKPGQKMALRHQRALFLQRDEWGQPLVSTYDDAFKRTGSHEQALVETQAKALDLIHEMGPKYADFDRSHYTAVEDSHGIFHSTGDPKLDHARILALDTQGFLLGPRFAENDVAIDGRLGADRRYYDSKTAEAIKDNRVPQDVNAFVKEVHSGLPDRAFNTVIGPTLTPVYGKASIRGIADLVQNRFLGKIVNVLSRDPTYIVDFARERKLLDARVSEGTMTQAEADVLAQTRAVANMRRFIHNPLDKTKWDEMMRVVAPFYFAQMQAWRRIGRLFYDNPGAFEQYVKLMMGATAGINKLGNNGFFTLPVSMFGLNLQASLNVSQSMDPFASAETSGATSPLQVFRESLLPTLGPVGTVPVKVWEDTAMSLSLNPALAHQFGNALLGQWESTPLWMSIVPNSILQHLVEGGAGTLGSQFGWNNNSVTSSYFAVQNNVIQYEWMSALQQGYDKNAHLKAPANSGLTDEQYRLGTTLAELLPKWDDPSWRQRFVASTNLKSAGLWAVRTALGALSPVPISTAAPFGKVVNYYQSLLTANHGDWQKAETEFLTKYPWAIFALTSKSNDPFGFTYPDTAPMVTWTLKNIDNVKKYSTGMVFLAPPGALSTTKNPYDDFAAASFNYLGLRKKTPLPNTPRR